MPGVAQLWLDEQELARLRDWGERIRANGNEDWHLSDAKLLDRITAQERKVACDVR